jgi:chitodextrinase
MLTRPLRTLRVTGATATIVLAGCIEDQFTGPRAPQLPRANREAASRTGKKIPGQYIVRLRDDVRGGPAVAAAIASAHGGVVRRTYAHAFNGFSVQIPDAAVAALAKHPHVLYVEQNAVVRVVVDQSDATWGIDRIDQHDLPLSTTYSYNATGDGVDVYILDTGIRFTHQEFGGRAVSGIDLIDYDDYADDCYGHGTHVAGTVGGRTYGVAKNARLISVRVLDCEGYGTYEGVIWGVDWLTGHHQPGQPAVANMSLGGYYNQALNDAVTTSVNAGVVYAVAAGNSYEDACWYSPASTPAAITVGATSVGDSEAEYSNRGTCLDMWAPGDWITSALSYDDYSADAMSGTSMAAPHVAGASALYLQSNPAASPSDVASALKVNASTGRISWYDPYGYKPAPPAVGEDYFVYTGFIAASAPAAPSAPASLTATAASFSEISLTWADNSTNENAFTVERCQDNGAACTDFTVVGHAGANSTGYQDAGLSGNATYRYRLSAYNSGGVSSHSNEAIAATPAPPPPPSAPSNLIATAVSTSQISLTWNDNSEDESYFYVERCQDADVPCTNFEFVAWTYANTTSYNDYWLQSGATYRYRVYAVNVGGSSERSDEAFARTFDPPPPPAAPSELTATAVGISQINLAWTDNSGGQAGFYVERCIGAGCTSFAQIAQLSSGVTTFPNSGLSSNTTYRYRIRAFNVYGISGYSNTAEATTFNQLPIPYYTWSCKNASCTFDGSASWDSDGSVVSFAWNFGDGTTSAGAAPSHRFSTRGNYNVTLTVTDNSGGSASRACVVSAVAGKTRTGTC